MKPNFLDADKATLATVFHKILSFVIKLKTLEQLAESVFLSEFVIQCHIFNKSDFLWSIAFTHTSYIVPVYRPFSDNN